MLLLESERLEGGWQNRVLDADLLLGPRASQVAAVDGSVPDARLGALVAARCPRPRCPDR